MRRSRPSLAWLVLLAVPLALPLGLTSACNEKAVQRTPDAGEIPGGLTAEQAQKPLAKFGDHVITLGDFAQVLSEMPEYERLRYQSLERRKELLRSMIDVLLLADEAKKQGLDQDPTVDEETRQIRVAGMRGTLLSDLPPPSAIPEAEARAWYDAHVDDYRQPERRRFAQIVSRDEATAKKAFDEAKIAGPTTWGALVKKYSDEPPGAGEAAELSGDVGYATAPSDAHEPASAKLTPAVRAAGFALKDVGDVAPPVRDALGWHVVKLLVREPAHEQSYSDVERSIRVRILQDQRAAREKAALDEAKQASKVEIDEAALGALATSLALQPSASTAMSAPVPMPMPSASASVNASASASGSGSAPAKPKPKPKP
ncbi:MAG: hypothetical protein NVSMB47_10880 [Polyangiales bacterium]